VLGSVIRLARIVLTVQGRLTSTCFDQWAAHLSRGVVSGGGWQVTQLHWCWTCSRFLGSYVSIAAAAAACMRSNRPCWAFLDGLAAPGGAQLQARRASAS
jgi:hypothetical protein